MEFTNVTATAKANIYFEGKVVSHGIILSDGSKKSFGLIYPGSYHFGTSAAELMEVIDGSCSVKIDGSNDVAKYTSGQSFSIEANSGFTIDVAEGICQYICSYLD